jgi:hypothetical protein
MHKLVNQVRDLELIEEELNVNPVGVMALLADSEKVSQVATTFLYRDKNIFIFFGSDDELYQSIQFNSRVVFTILRYDNIKKNTKINFDPTYNLFYVSISGVVKKIDEQKLIEEVQHNFIMKYKKRVSEDYDLSLLSNVVMIDTEEIQAFTEMGG